MLTLPYFLLYNLCGGQVYCLDSVFIYLGQCNYVDFFNSHNLDKDNTVGRIKNVLSLKFWISKDRLVQGATEDIPLGKTNRHSS